MRKIFYLILLSLFTGNVIQAQNGFSAESNFFIHNNNTGNGIVIHDTYELNSVVKTNRAENSSTFIFDKQSSWKQNTFAGYIDGKVTSNIETNFVFPVGNNEKYCPLALTNSKNSTVCYFNEPPMNFPTSGSQEFEVISKNGYWSIASNNTSKVSLYFSDNILNKYGLTILGFKNGNWVRISSMVDSLTFNTRKSEFSFLKESSTIDKGSITTAEEIDLSNYSALAVGTLSDASIISNVIGKAVAFSNIKSIHFPFNDKDLTEYSTNLLNHLILNIPQNAKLKLVGHTDFYGSSDYNYSFGMERANTIKTFFELNGITNVEIEIQSEGEDSPKVDCENCSSKEMVLNRRVDIYMVK